MCADSPDTSGINAAAKASAELGKEALAWYQAEYAKTQPQRDKAINTAQQVSEAQLAAMQTATQQAKDLDTRNKTVFQPLEDQIVKDAGNFDTAGRRLQAANEATADVETAFGNAQAGLGRTLARTGVTPGSGRSMSLMQDAALKKATAVAGATTGAVKNVEQQGYARKMDAAALGKGIVGNQATMQQIAQNGGAQAVGASGAAVSAANSGAGLMQTGFNTGLAGNQASGNLYGQAVSLGTSGGGAAGLMGGIGGLMQGAGAMGWSSKKLKTKKQPINEDEALAAVNDLNVEGWDYKDGVADGGTHVGPYAEDVQRASGNAMAPGGRMVNMTMMAQQNGGALKALTRKLADIESEIAALEAA